MSDRSIVAEVRRRKLTYLGDLKLDSLYDCIDSVKNANLQGDFTEFGIALGGSGICIAHELDGQRRYLGFDVFGMIPPPSEIDGQAVQARYEKIRSGASHGIAGDKYYGYIDNLYDQVKQTFADLGCPVDGESIILVKGLFEETLPSYGDVKVALAHIDCDWYDPVTTCLNYVWPRLTEGGFIILDDYNDWDGCEKATDAFLASHPQAQVVRTRPQAVITKPISRETSASTGPNPSSPTFIERLWKKWAG